MHPCLMNTYPCICHVCGNEFDRESQVMAGPTLKGSDGRERLMYACPGKHTREEIRAAWTNLGKPTGVDVFG